jgi:hypothetical protein
VSRRRKTNSSRQTSQNGAASGTSQGQRKWYKADLHLHTPASSDYEDPQIDYLDWMRVVAERGLDIVAVTDHNTVAGVGAIRREIEWLTSLEASGRLNDEEKKRLAEWRELANQVLVLPGFEFTATFGFHILGLFPPETSVRHLEHVLLSLSIPPDKLDTGSTETGASTDVLTAYQVIHEAGGLVIAAHANSTHGVAMRNFPFGGQTKIAYTQDPNLDALEVTDHDRRGRSTARFFNGSKAEYPRRMHCIQGSDAHRLNDDPKNPKRLGIGSRATEFLLTEPSFEAIAEVLRSKQFDRTRPARPKDQPFDSLAAARAEGPSIVQSFHESASQRGGRITAILSDICAFANTAGGTVYVGANHRTTKPRGLPNPTEVQQEILSALDERLTPPLDVRCDVIQSQNARVLRIQVPKGSDRPYCLDDYKYYVRDETDSSVAVRDELIALVSETLGEQSRRPARTRSSGRSSSRSSGGSPQESGGRGKDASTGTSADRQDAFYLPQIGVEIVDTEARQGNSYHSIRDLRNGRVIKNVTRKGARKLWSYAIQQHEDNPADPSQIQWNGNVGLVHAEKRAGKLRYDLALRENGDVRIFYGVTEDGMEGRWSTFVQDE